MRAAALAVPKPSAMPTQINGVKGPRELHGCLLDSWTLQRGAAPFHQTLRSAKVLQFKAHACHSARGKAASGGAAGGRRSQR